jgi:hypothetical protein
MTQNDVEMTLIIRDFQNDEMKLMTQNDLNYTWTEKNDAKYSQMKQSNANYLRPHNLTQKHGQNKMTQLIHNA